MNPKKSRSEIQIRRHFGLPEEAELFYYRRGIKKDANGNPLRGWFLQEGSVLRHLGTSVFAAKFLSTKMHAAIVPRKVD